MSTEHADHPVLYFDGVCNLCNGSVQFVIRHDKKEKFLFAPLQSEAGKIALQNTADAGKGAGSVILYYNGRYYTRSSAALHVLRLLSLPWNWLYVFIVIPPFIRNGVYDFISARRYRWFGQQIECMIPTPALKKRFLM